ncbi:uroporphyrinogen III synthetase [Intrasporangium oryzae NRRL B-24470]|uniref:Uroporphyrinogen III synthetase n=1 Tax=Intrasporangium oryzae NRRL B-24470 TaxID=1386089 RepID=W9G310_9MICO|nr:uroporphyrinogen-III synthase [Intrasporangium oryzae]EWS99681.1 uroporphyrinogen III synthetase [Intrasporangium oryzae NRRL B-24470]
MSDRAGDPRARRHPSTAWSEQLSGPDPEAEPLVGPGAGSAPGTAQAGPIVSAEPPEPPEPVLAGFRIAVTSDRRSEDLVDAFARRGADVVHAPAVRIAPVDEDEILLEDTRAIIAGAPDVVIVTTAYGFRRWVECAEAAGLGDALARTLDRARIIVRGPKARGAVRAAGHDDDAIAADERTASAVGLALDADVRGRTVAVQLHGHEDVEQLDRLVTAGATVHTVAPYRWVRPTDDSRLGRLVAAIAAREVDVVTFTSAPAVDGLVSAAAQLGMDGVLVEAMRCGVTAAAVGPVTATPLLDLGISPIVPERFRMGALIRVVVEHLTLNGVAEVQTALGPLRVHGRTVRFGGETVTLARGPRAMLGALMSEPGAVLSRERLLDELPDAENEHALDMAMSRLRAALPDRHLVQTVVRRGYRLNV